MFGAQAKCVERAGLVLFSGVDLYQVSFAIILESVDPRSTMCPGHEWMVREMRDCLESIISEKRETRSKDLKM